MYNVIWGHSFSYIYSLLMKLGYFHDDMSSCKWINLKHKSKFITYRWMYKSKKLIFTFVSCHTRFPLETRRTLSVLVSCRIHSFLSQSVNFSSCILPSSHAWLHDLFSFIFVISVFLDFHLHILFFVKLHPSHDKLPGYKAATGLLLFTNFPHWIRKWLDNIVSVGRTCHSLAYEREPHYHSKYNIFHTILIWLTNFCMCIKFWRSSTSCVLEKA